jgi:hypothetical protein
MFPRLREQLGTAVDLIVEFSTLGEYRLGAGLAPGAPAAPADAPGHAPQLGGAGYPAGRAAGCHTVAGGATGRTPVATPAARRLLSAVAGPAPGAYPAACGPSSGGPCTPSARGASSSGPYIRSARGASSGGPYIRSAPASSAYELRGIRRAGAASSPEQLCFVV